MEEVRPAAGHPAQRAADLAIGTAVSVAPYGRVAARVAMVPVVVGWRLVRRPPLIPERFTPAALAARLEARGRLARELRTDQAVDATVIAFDALVPTVTSLVIDRLDLPDLVAQVLTPQVVNAAVGAVDVPSVISQVLTPDTVDAALDQLDPVAIAEQRLDPVTVEKLVTIALPPVMESVLRHLDLTEIVRQNVDLLAITNGVVDEMDLAGITNEVIDEIDLPGIIRESTSGVATDMVRGTRATAATADEAVARFFGRRRGGDA